jgi:multiple sugar transport system permease protein
VKKSKLVTVIALIFVLVWTLVPLYWFGKSALQTKAEISEFPPNFYPKRPTISGLLNVLGFYYTKKSGEVMIPSGGAKQVTLGLLNSLILSVCVTIITMLVVVPLAYTFGRLEFKHKNALLFAVLLSVALPPIAVLIPFYILFTRVGLAGNLIGLIIVTLTVTIPFVTWMLLGFFRNLPRVERLARIDGYTRFGAFIRIIVPMGKIGIVVGAIIAFLFAWNEYTFSLILVNGTKATTIPPAVSGFLYQHPEPEHLAAAIIYSLIPPFIVVYLLQKHISKMHIAEPME